MKNTELSISLKITGLGICFGGYGQETNQKYGENHQK